MPKQPWTFIDTLNSAYADLCAYVLDDPEFLSLPAGEQAKLSELVRSGGAAVDSLISPFEIQH